MGPSGQKSIKKNLKNIIQQNKIDFTIVNGENAAEDGKGITKEISDELFELGVDVITSGNHIFDKEETVNLIKNENRLLRPANMAEGTPGKGYNVFFAKNEKINRFKIKLKLPFFNSLSFFTYLLKSP